MIADGSDAGWAATDATVAKLDPPQRQRCRWFDPTIFPEPTLAELLRDPLVQRLMKSDGVKQQDLERLLNRIAG